MHLTMIVRNEAARIRRTIESALPHVNSYTILDTGSIDRTRDVALKTLGDLPGQYIPTSWPESFAVARNQAFAAARAYVCQAPRAYLLVLDAGEQLGTDGPIPELTADAYRVQVNYGACEFTSARIFRARAPWAWRYRVHEIPAGGGTIENSPGVEIFSDAGDTCPEKYLKYARLSELDLVDFPNDPRVVFYSAQNWFAAGEYRNALERYEQRVGLGSYPDEVWYSAMRMGMCYEHLGDKQAAAQCYADAHTMQPDRAEPARHLARLWGVVADAIPCPASGLFVERDKYKL